MRFRKSFQVKSNNVNANVRGIDWLKDIDW
jgi:hypothetical protein